MWQRIQTVYFVLVIIFMIAGVLLPNAEFFSSSTNTSYLLDSRGIVELNDQGEAVKKMAKNPCTFIFGVILFLTTFSIASYKNRRKQIRYATMNLFCIIIYMVALAIYIFYAKGKLDVEISFNYPIVFSAIALIFNYLGMRGIAKDEKLIKSMDRLR